MTINEKLKCPECQGTVFKFYGILKEEYGFDLLFKCANYECKNKPYQIKYSEPYFEIIVKGLYCSKCKTFGEDRYWNKNKRGYDIKCFNCGNEEFEPE